MVQQKSANTLSGAGNFETWGDEGVDEDNLILIKHHITTRYMNTGNKVEAV